MSAQALPSIRFHLSETLHAETLEAVETIAADAKPREYSIALGDMVVELTQAGLNYYFGQALRQADAGFVITKTADVGLAATLKVMAPVIRNIIGQLNDQQIREVCNFMRNIMTEQAPVSA